MGFCLKYGDVLVVLQDQALQRREGNEIDVMFKEDFGMTKEMLFKEFNATPITAASLA